MISSPPQPQTGFSQNDLFRGFSSIGNKLSDRLKEGGLGGGFENLLSGVKNLLPTRRELVVSKIVSDIMTPPQNEVSKASDYLYFDPKVSKNSRSPRQHKVTFQEAIVFVVGGGNYVEYQNLQELATVSIYTGSMMIMIIINVFNSKITTKERLHMVLQIFYLLINSWIN